MKKSILLASVLGLALAACDSNDNNQAQNSGAAPAAPSDVQNQNVKVDHSVTAANDEGDTAGVAAIKGDWKGSTAVTSPAILKRRGKATTSDLEVEITESKSSNGVEHARRLRVTHTAAVVQNAKGEDILCSYKQETTKFKVMKAGSNIVINAEALKSSTTFNGSNETGCEAYAKSLPQTQTIAITLQGKEKDKNGNAKKNGKDVAQSGVFTLNR